MRSALFLSLLATLVLPVAAQAQVVLFSEGGHRFDFQNDGTLGDGTSDSYDNCYTLNVDGLSYTGGMPTASGDGRTLSFPLQTLGAVMVQRIAYVPLTGGDYARYADVIANAGPSSVSATVVVAGNLGSDGSTTVTGSSSGDTVFDASDDWVTTNDGPSAGGTDDALGHVTHGPGGAVRPTQFLASDSISWAYGLTIPSGGRAVILTFAIQKTSLDDAGAAAEARTLDALPPDAVVGLGAYLADVVNFVTIVPCVGLDGSACTGTAGVAGTCLTGSCCTTCVSGGTCSPAGAVLACGIGGGACTSCSDTEVCTLDSCNPTTGTCVHAPASTSAFCDDGLYCTLTDRCDGAGACVGSGATCDDASVCTTDACSEATGCSHTTLTDGVPCLGSPGSCRAGACCYGCWNGTTCEAGTATTACGASGALCANCDDGNVCTNEQCASGVCGSAGFARTTVACDDAVFCTAGDHCDGGGGCASGALSACDDGSGCTADVCDEAARACMHTTTGAPVCDISGTCRATGETAPGAPCLVCDPARSTTAWSTNVGATCGTPSCAAGMLTAAPVCSASLVCASSGSRTPCATGTCLDATTCRDTCATDTDCATGFFCDTGSTTCRHRLPRGITCDRDAECVSGSVCSADHHCCDSACSATCSSCVVPAHEGMCRAVPPETDPDGDCPGSVCGPGATCRPADGGVPLADGGAPADAADDAAAADGSSADGDVDAGPVTASSGCCGVAGTGRRGAGWAGLLLAVGLLGAIARRRDR